MSTPNDPDEFVRRMEKMIAALLVIADFLINFGLALFIFTAVLAVMEAFN